MVPVLFAYGGWQTATFVAGEIREPRKNLPRALIIGVTGVVILYLAVNFVCIQALGVSGLSEHHHACVRRDATRFRPDRRALDCCRHCHLDSWFSQPGYVDSAACLFRDGRGWSVLPSVGRLHPKTHVPILAIVLQGLLAIVIALSGATNKILNYVVSVDFIFFGATAMCIFIFQKTKKGGHALPHRDAP